MALLPILTGADNPILRKKTKKVGKITQSILRALEDMEDTTAAVKGAGIAAPQIGRIERMCIAMLQRKLTPLINPVIAWRSRETITTEEGCLSLPDVWLMIKRSQEIVLQYTDTKGKQHELKLSDMDARVVQHEVDHLEGVLIVDYGVKM